MFEKVIGSRLAFCAAVALTAVVGFADKVNKPLYIGPARATEISHSRAFTGIPSIACASNGRLWATWYAGPFPGEDSYSYVVLATSANGGDSWEEVLVVQPDSWEAGNARRAFDSQVWVDPNGNLRWFWADRAGTMQDVANDGVWMVNLGNATSVPQTLPTASDAVCIYQGVMLGKPVVLNDGAWAFPVAQWYAEPSSLLIVSTDECATFTRRGGATIPSAQRSFDEHSIVPLSNNVIRCWARTGDGVRESISTDGGVTWPEMTVPANLRTAGSRLCACKLPSGSILMVKHGTVAAQAPASRSQLTAFVSRDGGDTWEGGLVIDAREDVAYPDATVEADGTIRLVYDYDRTGRQEILMATFTEADVLAKTGSSAKFRLCQRVSTPSYLVNDSVSEPAGKVLSFDGKRGYAMSADVGIGSSATGEFTIECWVRPSSFTRAENIILSQYTAGVPGRMSFYIGNNSGSGATNDRIGMFVGANNNVPNARWVSTGSIPHDQWAHVALVVSQNDARFYINGQFDSMSHYAAKPGLYAAGLGIGGLYPAVRNSGDCDLFQGKIADLRVWSRARSGQEIAANYNRRLSGAEYGLLAYWPLKEGGDHLENVVGKGLTLIPTAGHIAFVDEAELTLHPAGERLERANFAMFTGASGQYIQTDVQMGASEAFTVEAWVRPNAWMKENRLFSIYQGGTLGRQIVELVYGRVGMYVNGKDGQNAYLSGGPEVPITNAWSHIALTRAASGLRYFVNGRFVGKTDVALPNNLPVNVQMGGYSGESFHGDMREVRMWSGVRTDEEIAANYFRRLTGTEANLKGYWPLDEDLGTAPTNLVTGAACAWYSRKVGTNAKIVNLAGAPEPVEETNRWAPLFGNGAEWFYVDTKTKVANDFTLEAWVRPTSYPERSYIMTQFSYDGVAGRMLFCLISGRLSLGMWNEQDTVHAGGWLSAPGTVPLNVWTHVAVTRCGDMVTLYQNGVAVASRSNFVTVDVDQTAPLRLAYRADNGVRFYGMLAEAKVWNVARSQQDIQKGMNHSLRGTEGGLLGYWPLDEGAGNVATNIKRNAESGFVRAAWMRTSLIIDDPLPPGGTLFLIR